MQLDVKDAAGIFSVSEKTILRWIKQKDLPSYQVNDHYRFNRAELLEWATERKIDLSTQIMSEPGEGEEPPPRLDEALRLGGIFHRVGGRDKISVLSAVVDTMHLPPEVDRICTLSSSPGEGITRFHCDWRRHCHTACSPSHRAPDFTPHRNTLFPGIPSRIWCSRRPARGRPVHVGQPYRASPSAYALRTGPCSEGS